MSFSSDQCRSQISSVLYLTPLLIPYVAKILDEHFQVQLETIELHPCLTTDVVPQMHVAMTKELTILATRSLRRRPYLATTGRSTSATGLVGLAFKPTDLLIGTRSNLNIEDRREIFIVYIQYRHELLWYGFLCIIYLLCTLYKQEGKNIFQESDWLAFF